MRWTEQEVIMIYGAELGLPVLARVYDRDDACHRGL